MKDDILKTIKQYLESIHAYNVMTYDFHLSFLKNGYKEIFIEEFIDAIYLHKAPSVKELFAGYLSKFNDKLLISLKDPDMFQKINEWLPE